MSSPKSRQPRRRRNPAPARGKPGAGRPAPALRPGPAGGARDRNRRANAARLGEAGLALFLEHGVAAVTIEQIAARAGMAKGSFYRYAADKADLVGQIMAPVIADTVAALDACAAGLRTIAPAQRSALLMTYLEVARALATVVTRDPPRVLLYLQEARAPRATAAPALAALATELEARTVELTRLAHAHGLIRAVDPDLTAQAVLGTVEAVLFAHLRRRRIPAAAVARVTTELVDLVVRGIGAEA
ncbi:MAG: TetR/AcrR family transcriptional regulator [Kofleriaceae bacterium]|nr:TetR/AcrR family transcriptional regulator [Kofleriaceae bacterium]